MTLPVHERTEAFFSRELLTDATMAYEERRVQLLEAGRGFLAHHKAEIARQHQEGASGHQVVGSLTSLMDTLIRNLYRSVSVDVPATDWGACTLIAIGGYGRGELNPFSDVDLMFYHGGKDRSFAERISERILYLLWDIGLEVGYSVRTARDCLEMAERDITARTALIDSRFLVGDEVLFREYEKGVLESVFARNTQAFIREKQEENERRLRKYGSSVYLLEPNLKEGEGGLRDLHTALWIAQVKFKARSLQDLIIKGVMTESEGSAFRDALDYLWRVRNELHYQSGRKNDQLLFHLQEKIALFLGYRDHKKALAVEQFMQHYYAHATQVEHIGSMLLTKATLQEDSAFRVLGYLTRRPVADGFFILRGELRASRNDLFEQDPAAMMTAFALAQRHKVRLAIPLKGLIRDNLSRINDRVRRSKAMAEGFLEILRSPHGVVETLRTMHHLQFLNQFIPEFGRIYCKVQHDAYHIYTVDIHSLFAMEEITRLWQGEQKERKPRLTQVANDIEKRELLLLAVLFHDIGKGEGQDHCNKGADLIPTIARRLGLNREDSQRLEFLVRNHLKMAHISQRRDLHDDKLIIEFAKTMGMSENLKMLYLLTYADIRAVGPDVWSEWKGLLLEELFDKTYEIIERGNFSQERRSEKVRNRKAHVLERLQEEYDGRLVKETLKSLSTRYLMSHRSKEIAEHLRLVFSRKERTLAMRVEHDAERGYSQVTISTIDIPGLFSKITGVMAASGMNILGAQIYTHSSGVALDILQVRGPAGEAIVEGERWQRIEENLVAVIEGRVRVDELVRKRQRPMFLTDRPRPRIPNRVDIHNEVSDEYTVIDIFAHDKVGLLYQITKALKELGLYIGVSKISTKVDQISDTFYVQDIFGQKITDADKLAELRARLLESLEVD